MTRYYPRDTRWQGPQRHYFTASNIRALVLIVYVILVIVEGVLIRKWLGRGRVSAIEQPYAFWARTGPYLLGDAVLSLVAAFLIHKEKWHPIAALVTAILAFGLWFAGCFLNSLIVYSNEYYFEEVDKWRNICYGEAALQALLAVCYLVMMGFAAKAVHEWRKAGKQSAEFKELDEGVAGTRYNVRPAENDTVQNKADNAV
ncbi:hypothetical protein N0V90_009655 [Kalmusia sp. IMI 367209]|nr:hypothetical protein N0V90_009655 [Kalmusia sp. IMI 367209]